MPPVSGPVVRPSAAQEYAGLTRASFRSLYAADLLPEPGKLRKADVVLARLCRYIYWSGPSLTAPGQSQGRERQREVAASVVAQVRRLLKDTKEGVPQRIVVSLDDGTVRELRTAGDAVDIILEPTALPGAWMSVPLRDWWDEAKTLPTGAEGVVRGT